MRIYNNVNAVNAQRNLSITGFALAKSIEKLSSGLRINRAADDAAGLSISEKLRAQIRGVMQAMRNAQDGVSMIQTAEGALNEVHSMLQRMRELAVQAANDTLTLEDRRAINSELQNLQQEINAIANRTTFNGKSLLTGSLATSVHSSSTFAVGSRVGSEGQVTDITINGTLADGTYTFAYDEATNTLSVTGPGSYAADVVLSLDDLAVPTTFTVDDGSGNGFTLQVTNTFRTVDQLGRALAGRSIEVDSGNVAATSDLRGDPDTTIRTALAHVSAIDVSGALAGDTYTFSYNQTAQAITLTRGSDGAVQTINIGSGYAPVPAGGRFTLNFEALGVRISFETTTGLNTPDDIGFGLDLYELKTSGDDSAHFQVGPNSGHSYVVKFSRVLVDNDASTPELQNLYTALDDFANMVGNSPGTNADQVEKAKDLITALDGAISYVNNVRSQLGAAQNRLEHTIANLGVQHENLTASESRIRDVDMAAEMVTFTRNQILQQAGVAVLAQANAMPQSVLQLLR
jgi:flagellin